MNAPKFWNGNPAIACFDEDTDAKFIIAKYGMIEQLSHWPNQRRNFAIWGDGTIPAIFIGARFAGHEDPTDNGFMVWILDASVLSIEQMNTIAEEIMGEGRDWSGQGHEAFVEVQPEAN